MEARVNVSNSRGSNNNGSNKLLLIDSYAATGFRLEGNYPIVEIVHQAAAAATDLVVTGCAPATTTTPSTSEFRPGLCYYRGLFFKYHKLVSNPDIEPALLEQHQEIINQTSRQVKLLYSYNCNRFKTGSELDLLSVA